MLILIHKNVDIMNAMLLFYCHDLCLDQVMWTMRWRRSFPSTCSLEQALALDPPLSIRPAVVPVPPPLMESHQPPADLVVDNPHDPHKVNCSMTNDWKLSKGSLHVGT